MNRQPTMTGIFKVLASAAVGDLGARVALPADLRPKDQVTKLAIALNMLLSDLSVGSAKRDAQLSELRQTEGQLIHAQKMEGIGKLAGGVAHDFNNLLQVILGYGDLVLNGMAPGDPMRAPMEEILRAGERASVLTRQLLAFSRQQLVEPKLLDLAALVEGMRGMLVPLIREDVELRIIPAPASAIILADVGQIEQVVMNLVVNARDAMAQGGLVVIRTELVELDGLFVREHLDAAPGPHVMLSITDTGHGMDDATKAHIFEPFFTTKGVGEGTGLGLSTVYGIVRQNNGSIWVYSEPGKGTVFKVYFPLASGTPLPAAASAASMPLARGTKTILLAEDDKHVREVTSGTLRRNGYLVLDAGDAAQALALAGGNAGKISLLLTDVVMPKVNGRELATLLQPKRPGLKVLYMSGYTDNVIHHNNVLDPGVVVLEKPFTQDALLRKVRGVLDAVPEQGKA